MGKTYTVYKITNLHNNKCYIGSTTRGLKTRKRDHINSSKHGSSHLIHKALRKYTTDMFTWEVIESCDTLDEMYAMEFHYIIQYDTMLPHGYNMTYGYDNTTLGYKFSSEAKKLQSERMKGENNPNYGVKWTKEQRLALSKSMTGKNLGDNNPSKRPEVRKKISSSKLGNLNHKSKKWLLIDPDGFKYTFIGGIKRHMKALGLSYEGSLRHRKGITSNYKGWIITNENI